MQEEILKLQEKVAKLELENIELKNSVKHEEEAIGFEFIFNAVKQPLFLLESIDSEGVSVHRVNNSAIELLKYSRAEIGNMSVSDIGLFESIEGFNKYQAMLSKNDQVSYITKIKTKDNNSISSEITLFKFPSNGRSYFLAFQRNIGNQQKVVEALRQSEYRFLQMAESVVEGIIIDEDNKRVFINSSICKITGYTKDELKDMDEFVLARKDEAERIKLFKDKINEMPQGVFSLEYWIVTKEGTEKCIKTNYSFSLKASGKKSTYIITSDITLQKRVEQALRNSQSEFRMLAENSPDLITRYSRDLKYIYVNATFENVTGIPVTQFIGKNNLELDLEPELISFLEEMHLEVFRTGRKLKFEFRLQIRKKQRVYQAHMVPELSKNGAVESVLNVARDISQIKEVERTLKEEKELVIIENRLIGNHLIEWCNKLCSMQSISNLSTPERCLQPIIRIAEWAQHGYQTKTYTPSYIVTNSLLQDFYNSNAERIQACNLESSLFLPVPNISIFSDDNFIIKTLDLLLDNALESTKEGKIEIGFDIYNDKEIVFYVKDTGNGIDPDDSYRIFEPFVSVDKPEHAGLGLSIAKKNVSYFEGTLWCLSSPGTGSTFCFTHPAQIEKSLIQSRSEKEDETWKGKTVIIVEDNDSNFILLESILKMNKPKIIRAINGNSAVDIIRDNVADLILLDIQLPGMNGYDVAREVRKFNIKVPIIAQTAYAMYNDVVKALDAGCNDFIPKPIKAKKLLSLMGKYLDEPEQII